MKIRFILTIIAVISSFYKCPAQYDDKKVLMTVAGRDVEAGEFVRMYRKSFDPSYKTGIKEYLDQFIAFKLKVAEALEKGYDTTKAFHDELSGYRRQLARSYLTDPGIREDLLAKAGERYSMEVSASHIFFSCRTDASPEDTLKAWKKALETRERIMNGEPFEKVAMEVSDDRSVRINGGNIGYFTVFQMVRPFEDTAFTLPPGSVSMPVRTSYGYHIIRVNNKRPAKGKIRVAHIMKAIPQGSDEQNVIKAETEINDIYSRLKAGESFSRLAAELSDHKESAKKGGEMNWFGTGEIISDFAEPAFALKDTGDFTKPVRTPYGFHIIKLLERKPLAPWAEIKPIFEARINQSDIDALGKRSFISKLKKEYGFSINQEIRDWFVKNADSSIMSGKARFDSGKIPEGNIFTFACRSFTAKDFASFLENRPARYNSKNPGYYIDSSIDVASSEEIEKYEDSVLENKYPDFRYLMAEFHDGILLFDISSEKIWNRIQDDTAGLRNYYMSNRGKFLSLKSIEGRLYTFTDKSGKKRLASAFRKFGNLPDCDERMQKAFNTAKDTLLRISEGKWSAGNDPDIDALPWTPGIHHFVRGGFPSVMRIEKVNEPVSLTFNEVQAEVISGYQDWLTDNWVKQLKEKYYVKVDSAVYEEVRKELADD
jgi:peptidyl-prolyl cis-trans isomerase SurA